jgi:tetratricopeptide (TPR) repeat protein
LFNVVAYANNVNDNFTKNILKTLLSEILKSKNNTKKALEILDEQVGYFAKEKVATGVLLSWYLIAQIRLVTKGTQFALDIATKALDIAQGPNINNYYFISLFNKLIGEIYIAKQDFESAKVYIEKSIFISKQFDLENNLFENYIQYAKLYQELALPKSAHRAEYVKNALKMFQLAKSVPIVSEHKHLQHKVKEELAIFTSFCKLNGITLKKSK